MTILTKLPTSNLGTPPDDRAGAFLLLVVVVLALIALVVGFDLD